MVTTLLAGALLIAPSLLIWSAFRSQHLNGKAAKVARIAERQAWLACGLAILASAAWWIDGRQAAVISPTGGEWIGMRMDAVSVSLLVLVTFLGAIILRFSKNYLSGEANHGRFTKWMCVTLGSVVALVTSPGLAQFLAAWIATSLSLHQLLVFYPERHGTLFSARKKFLLSRIGDLCLAVAFWELYRASGTQSFESLLLLFESGSLSAPALIPWLIAIAALFKSAQFPFHTWLPETMGTPTPVSALMHAGIINAGGFLVIRFAPVFQGQVGPLYLLALCGAFTAAFASLVMLTQTSVKRSLAYSTIAQMGFMMMQCGLGAYHLALLHIVAHSLYKAHTFLSSGSAVSSIQARPVEREERNKSPLAVCLPLLAGFAMASLPLWFSDTAPGALVFAAVLAAALAQFLSQSPSRKLASNIAIAVFIGALYLSLKFVAAWWIQPTVSLNPVIHPGFEVFIAVAVLTVFILFIQVQTVSLKSKSPQWARRLYVHALNGFYLNTIANRAIRFLRLHPDEA